MTSRTKFERITSSKAAPLWLNLDAHKEVPEHGETSPENYTWHKILQSNKPLPNRTAQTSTINEKKQQAYNKNEMPGRVFDVLTDCASKVEWNDIARVQRTSETSRALIANTGYVTRNLTNNKLVPNYSRLNGGQFECADEQNLALNAGNKEELQLQQNQLSKRPDTPTSTQFTKFQQGCYDNQYLSTAEKALEEKKLHSIRTAEANLTANQSKRSINLEPNTTPRRQITPRMLKAHRAPPNLQPHTAVESARNSHLQRVTVPKTDRVPNNEPSRAEVPFSPKEIYNRSHLSQDDTLATVSRGMLDDYARKGRLLTANRHREMSKQQEAYIKDLQGPPKKSIIQKSYQLVNFTESCAPHTKQRSATNENNTALSRRPAKSEISENTSMLPSLKQFLTHDYSRTTHPGYTLQTALNTNKQTAAITTSNAVKQPNKQQYEQQFPTATPYETSIDVDRMLQQRNRFLDPIKWASKRSYPTSGDAKQHYRLEKESYFPQTKAENNLANVYDELNACQSIHSLQFSGAAQCTAKHVTWCDQPKPKAFICKSYHLQIPKNSACDNDCPSATGASGNYLDLEDVQRSQSNEIPTRPTNTTDAHKLLETLNESMDSYMRALMTALFEADPVTFAEIHSIGLDGSSENELELPAYTNCPCMLPIYTALAKQFANIRY